MGEKDVQISRLSNMYLEFPAQAPYAYSVSDTGGSEEKKLRRPPGGKFMSKIFLPKTMVSVLHKDLKNKVEKLWHKKVGGPQPRITVKSELPVGELTILEQSTQSFTVVTD